MSSDQKSLKQIMNHRLEKLHRIQSAGINPFPYRYEPTHFADNILNQADKLMDTTVTVAGRLVSFRKMGKASFAHIQDETGHIQVYLKNDQLPEQIYDNVVRNLDLGDIIGCSGNVFKTRTEEISIHCSALTLLSKNIRPLPNLKEKDGDTFNAFEDKELRYRQRHLDLIINPEVKKTFELRAKIISALRNTLDNYNFIEVETPVLQPIYGGASARPFTTFHNTLEQELYLRIADELYLKRLVIGGFTKVYELAKNFRNEGMDRNHNPEFTALEYYQAYADVYDMMDLTEKIIHQVAKTVSCESVFFSNHKINLQDTFLRVSMFDLFKETIGIDVSSLNNAGLYELCKENQLNIEEKMNYGQLLDKLFGELIEPTLIQPTFVMDYPVEISPLAKEKRDGDGKLVERFELFIGGMEFANSFSELNDPIEQRNRLETQAKLKESGDDEAQVVDENFLQAMEVAMPPTGGVGIGVDRLVMLLTEQNSIKDVILFPAMRPE